MIIQCEQCQTRFRLADEKLKPEGIKVRCSKCKHIFRVIPPEEPSSEAPSPPPAPPTPQPPPPETEPAAAPPPPPPAPSDEEEDVDFGSFNMEPEEEDAAEEPAPPEAASPREPVLPSPEADDSSEEIPPPAAEGDEGAWQEEEFTFGEEEAAAETTEAEDFGLGAGEESAATEEEGIGLEDEEEIVFEEEPVAAPSRSGLDFDTGPEAETFGFEEEQPVAAATAGEESGEEESQTFGFEEEQPFGAGEGQEEDFGFGEETTGAGEFSWEEEQATSGTEEFEFGKPDPAESQEDLGFGEIPLGEGKEEGPAESAALAPEPSLVEEPPARPREPSHRERPPSPTAPPAGRRRPLRGVLLLLLFLLLGLGGAAGYWYWQEGSLDPGALLAKLTGEPAQPVGERIGISELSGFYVNNDEAGQLFVIRGRAINQYEKDRSALQLRAKLFNAQGKVVSQQAAYAGNPLSQEALTDWPYSRIAEAMNNQFGDSLSNLNVAPGKTVPFAIVFKDLPGDLAEFTVEPAGSQPGSR